MPLPRAKYAAAWCSRARIERRCRRSRRHPAPRSDMPSAARSFCASGIRPSPHALSSWRKQRIGDQNIQPSSFCRSAIAAPASPAGTAPDNQCITADHSASSYHSSSNISEQNPGPIAATTLRAPGFGRRCVITSSRTTSTEADDRLPTRCSASHESWSCRCAAPAHPPRPPAPLGPRVHDPGVDWSRVIPCSAKKASTSRPRFSLMTVGT